MESSKKKMKTALVRLAFSDILYGFTAMILLILELLAITQGDISVSPGAADILEMVLGSLFLLVAPGLFLYLSQRRRITLRRCMQQLKQRGLLDEAIHQFETAKSYPVDTALSRDFLYGLGSGVVLPVKDIVSVWVVNNPRTGVFLCVKDKTRRYQLDPSGKGMRRMRRYHLQSHVYSEIISILAKRNPKIGH